MGIDITEISQKVLDNNANAANVFRKQYDLHYNPIPLDVEIPWIDENGNTITTKIPNVASFRKKVWDDVGAALGQFNRTFYVDAENGDDNNTGVTIDQPFATLAKAIATTPLGGRAVVYILNDITHNTYVDLTHKYIYVRSHPDNEDATLTLDVTSAGGQSIFFNGYGTLILGVDITAQNTFDTNLRTISNTGPGFIYIARNYAKTANAGTTVRSTVDIKENTRFTYLSGRLKIRDTDITIADSSGLFYVSQPSAFDCALTNINGEEVTADNLSNFVSGIIKDADSGNPVNLISNINFSS